MKVRLLCDGGYAEGKNFNGKVKIYAEPIYDADKIHGFNIHEDDLEIAGFTDNDGYSLFFLPDEVEVVSK